MRQTRLQRGRFSGKPGVPSAYNEGGAVVSITGLKRALPGRAIPPRSCPLCSGGEGAALFALGRAAEGSVVFWDQSAKPACTSSLLMKFSVSV